METTETNPAPVLADGGVITIEKLIYGGDGLARSAGQVVFAPYVLPGESVRVEVNERKAQHLRVDPVEIIRPSPRRVAAPCPHFTHCGGCHYQHADYEYQVEQKLGILRETLERVGKVAPPENVRVITGEPLGYRNRVQFHMDQHGIGYHEEGSRRVQAIEQCLIASPKLQKTFVALKRMRADRRWPNFLRTLELFTNETDVQLNVLRSTQPLAKRFFEWCGEQMPGLVPGALQYEAAGFSFRVSHDAFFQINRFLTDRLVEAALEGAEGETALDLYSGVGLFALPLAKRFQRVAAVESGTGAWRDLQFNAQSAGLRLEAIHGSAEDHMATAPAGLDFVLADPPRTGLGKRVVSLLLVSRPPLLTIVSCDPATLARDLAALVDAYNVEAITMVDLFPQTYHLETVVRLRLK